MLVDVGDTRLDVTERGSGDPVLVLHGGPGLDHTEFGHWLDPLPFRLLLIDLREQGRSDRGTPPSTWTVAQMAADVDALSDALGLERFAVLGHSFGAFVALRHALDGARRPVGTIVSGGVPAEHWLEVDLSGADPVVAASFEREATVATHEDVLAVLRDQLPFHFADPADPRQADLMAAMAEGRMSPEVLRHGDYGDLDVEDRLGEITHPVLVLAGRHDRITTAAAAEAIAAGVPGAELVVLERSAHMGFVEEPDGYRGAVEAFLRRTFAT